MSILLNIVRKKEIQDKIRSKKSFGCGRYEWRSESVKLLDKIEIREKTNELLSATGIATN